MPTSPGLLRVRRRLKLDLALWIDLTSEHPCRGPAPQLRRIEDRQSPLADPQIRASPYPIFTFRPGQNNVYGPGAGINLGAERGRTKVSRAETAMGSRQRNRCVKYTAETGQITRHATRASRHISLQSALRRVRITRRIKFHQTRLCCSTTRA